MKKLWIALPLLVLFAFGFAKVVSHLDHEKFTEFVQQIRFEARQKGISQKTIDKYLTGLKAPKPKVLHLLTHQAQATITFQHYLKNFTPPSSIRRGKAAMKKYRKTLLAIEKKYGVQPQYIIALWGVESDFGKLQGKDNIAHSLVTLSYQSHRTDFYRRQLFAILKILDHQKIPQQALGEWDGGMGQTSFEPTAYENYAVDFDGDGFKNIWTSEPDVFASIANFLNTNGWMRGKGWGYEVNVPKYFDKTLAGHRKKHPVSFWIKHGVTQLNGKPLTTANNTYAAVLLPAGTNSPAYLVFDNFFALLNWNDTTFEGLSVSVLADKIAWKN